MIRQARRVVQQAPTDPASREALAQQWDEAAPCPGGTGGVRVTKQIQRR